MEPNRYSRQILFGPIGESGQQRLLASRAVIIGCGALGSTSSMLLARAGIGHLQIVDRDYVEIENLQRQVLFNEQDVKDSLPKAVAAYRNLTAVNSAIDVEPIVADVNGANVERLLGNADVIVDGTDNFQTRLVINDACVKLGKPWVYAGAVGGYGMVFSIVPGKTPCFRCFVGETPPPGSTPTCDTAGIINAASALIASVQTAEVLKILVGAPSAEGLLHVDAWAGTFQRFSLKRAEDCPCCTRADFEFLRSVGADAASLCGRNAVQINPAKAHQLNLADVAKRFAGRGVISANKFLLRLEVEGFQVTLFPDGRAIVKGTDDPARARSVYAKFIGV